MVCFFNAVCLGMGLSPQCFPIWICVCSLNDVPGLFGIRKALLWEVTCVYSHLHQVVNLSYCFVSGYAYWSVGLTKMKMEIMRRHGKVQDPPPSPRSLLKPRRSQEARLSAQSTPCCPRGTFPLNMDILWQNRNDLCFRSECLWPWVGPHSFLQMLLGTLNK